MSRQAHFIPFRVLTYLLYGLPPLVQVDPEARCVVIPSIKKFGRLLGMDSWKVRPALLWLEDKGYLETVAWGPNRHSIRFRIRRPPNVQ